MEIKDMRQMLQKLKKNKWFLGIFALKKIITFAAIIFSLCMSVQGAVLIKATVDKNKITIGDNFIYTITVEYNSGEQVKVPQLGMVWGEFEVKDYRIKGPKNKIIFQNFLPSIKKVIKYRYFMTTFTTGEYKIPAINVEYTTKEGKAKTVSSGEISIFVEGVKPSKKDTGDIRDIKPPLRIPRGWLFYFLLFLIPLLLVACAFGYYYYTNRKEGIFSQADLNRPADEVAYERLNKLKELELIKQEKIKEYYIIISEIIRRYMEQRYGIPVLDRTTNELYRELREVKEIEKKHVTMVKDFLEECDLVKFAKYVPEEGIISSDTDSAYKIVDLTKPAVVQQKETNEGN